MIFTNTQQCINANQPKLTEAEIISKRLHELAGMSGVVYGNISSKMRAVVHPTDVDLRLGENPLQEATEFTPLFDDYRSLIAIIEDNLAKIAATVEVAQLPTLE